MNVLSSHISVLFFFLFFSFTAMYAQGNTESALTLNQNLKTNITLSFPMYDNQNFGKDISLGFSTEVSEAFRLRAQFGGLYSNSSLVAEPETSTWALRATVGVQYCLLRSSKASLYTGLLAGIGSSTERRILSTSSSVDFEKNITHYSLGLLVGYSFAISKLLYGNIETTYGVQTNMFREKLGRIESDAGSTTNIGFGNGLARAFGSSAGVAVGLSFIL